MAQCIFGERECLLCIISRPVTADLLIPFQRGRTFQKIHTLDDCIRAVSGSDFKHCPLDPPLAVESVKVCEQVQLIDAVVLRSVDSTHTKPAVKQAMVGFSIK